MIISTAFLSTLYVKTVSQEATGISETHGHIPRHSEVPRTGASKAGAPTSTQAGSWYRVAGPARLEVCNVDTLPLRIFPFYPAARVLEAEARLSVVVQFVAGRRAQQGQPVGSCTQQGCKHTTIGTNLSAC